MCRRATRRRGAGGTVELRVFVDAGGAIQDVKVDTSSGNADLDAAARKAAHRWTCSPGRRDGTPVAGTILIPVDFGPAR